MIAYGVCVRSPKLYEQICLPSIVVHGGESATLLTVTDTALTAGYNEILDAAAGLTDLEALVLLADDISLEDPDLTGKILQAMSTGTDVAGVIGATGGTTLDWWTWTRRHGGLHTPTGEVRHDRGKTGVEIVDGSCLILSPRAASALRFDVENYPDGIGADVDLCFQAQEHRMQIAVLDIEIRRHGEGACSRGPEYFAAAARFQAKWAHKIADRPNHNAESNDNVGRLQVDSQTAQGGGDRVTQAAGTKSEADAPVNYYGFDRPELVALVPSSARRVLDVGCAAGTLGAAIKRIHPECEVSGIEYVQSVVDQAATRLDRAIQADLNGPVDLPVPRGYFDVMIFGDVLEHLLDPTASLKALIPYLAPHGVVIASIPNVAHWSVMIPALSQDRWEYTDAGLLDRTHVHLFTLRESIEMLREVGLHVSHADANRIPLEPASRLDPLVAAAVAYGADGEVARELYCCYQYLLVASRSTPQPQ